jgi:hypothetical protein
MEDFKMRFNWLGISLLALPMLADASISLRNEREGGSFYQGRNVRNSISRATRDFGETQIVDAYQDVLAKTQENKLCAYDLNQALQERLARLNPRSAQLAGALHYLRSLDEIDDVSLRILLKAHEVTTTELNLPKIAEDLHLPRNAGNVDKMVEAIGTFEPRLSKNTCFDDAYKTLIGEIRKVDKGVSSTQLEALYVEAVKRGVLSVDAYKELEKARVNKVETQILGLKSYHQKLKSLRIQYPLPDRTERSEFVTARVEKQRFSRRQRLLENYSDLQIILMGNVIKKLRERLESPRVEILVYDHETLRETIALEPMERFRFAVRLLRKEMSHLALNTYFNGRTPDYMDLMTASYEIGIIPGSELDEIAGLREIWNPRKTFWDKAGIWVKSFSSVATIALPPPYGFLPALGIVVIEATVGKKQQSADDSTRLF